LCRRGGCRFLTETRLEQAGFAARVVSGLPTDKPGLLLLRRGAQTRATCLSGERLAAGPGRGPAGPRSLTAADFTPAWRPRACGAGRTRLSFRHPPSLRLGRFVQRSKHGPDRRLVQRRPFAADSHRRRRTAEVVAIARPGRRTGPASCWRPDWIAAGAGRALTRPGWGRGLRSAALGTQRRRWRGSGQLPAAKPAAASHAELAVSRARPQEGRGLWAAASVARRWRCPPAHRSPGGGWIRDRFDDGIP